jgi:carboxyl-terminal processing protease
VKLRLRATRWPAIAALSCALVATTAVASDAVSTQQADDAPPACATPSSGTQPPPVEPTTATTIEQAYYCIFANYYGGPALDDRTLLIGAFAGLTQELDILGDDQPDATMPALTGDRDSDWTAFSTVYQHIIDELPNDPTLRQQVAEATMNGMVSALDDNHAGWAYPPTTMPPGAQPGETDGLGIQTTPTAPLAAAAPHEALGPLYISSVQGPSAQAGLLPGDVIESVDGSAPFVDGSVSPGEFGLLEEQYPDEQPVQITLWRPATNLTWTVSLTPALYTPTVLPTTSVTSTKLLAGDVAYIQLSKFGPTAATDVLNAIASLGSGITLRGVILDLRGDGGGDPAQAASLLGAFEHGEAWSYACNVSGTCTPNYPDATVSLLHLPLTVLTDRDCASTCDGFSAAVKDLHLGTLIGTRTAGAASGPAEPFLLDDGSALGLPTTHWLGPDKEFVNGIGVAPDYIVPLTAQDVSTGHDPDVAKALALLSS